jgi:hypothetical protein
LERPRGFRRSRRAVHNNFSYEDPRASTPQPDLASSASLKRISSPETDLAWQLLASTAPQALGRGSDTQSGSVRAWLSIGRAEGMGILLLFRVFFARRARVARIPISTHQRCFEASDCGRLGLQAAGHPWSALRAVKSCRKDCPTASVLPKPK